MNALERACRDTGWYAYRDIDCADRYVIMHPPQTTEEMAYVLLDMGRPGGMRQGPDGSIGTKRLCTAWVRANPRTGTNAHKR